MNFKSRIWQGEHISGNLSHYKRKKSNKEKIALWLLVTFGQCFVITLMIKLWGVLLG
jgi:hypothetical protein